MARMNILYPNRQDGRFDFPYYTGAHMPMSIELLSAHPGFKGVSVERGAGGTASGAAPTYVAMCHFLFSSAEEFMAAFLPNAETLRRDIKNYTDIEPVIQLNEVLIFRE